MTRGKKPKTLPPVRPNAGLEAAFQAKLDRMIEDMHSSVLYWLRAAYRANSPEMALDASPARTMQTVMRRLARKWQKRFDEAAPELAEYFSTRMADRVDGSLTSILKKAGFAVDFKMTDAANDVMQATIGEQVGLIKSIASEYLSDVNGMVMRSVAAGGDIGGLADQLQKRYGITRRRAALIARDQNNKATATMTRVRQEGLGITEAIWKHSHAGKHPRPSHLAADGERYKIKDGLVLDKVRCWPGTEINCRCLSRSIIPGF